MALFDEIRPEISTSKNMINQSVLLFLVVVVVVVSFSSYSWKHNKLDRILQEQLCSLIHFCSTFIPQE